MPRRSTRSACLVLTILCTSTTLSSANGQRADKAADFDKTIAPLLAAHCLECHSGKQPKGGLDLTTLKNAARGGDSGPALIGKSLSRSLVWQRVDAGEMPPKKPLGPADRKRLRSWILAGAAWGTSPIDRFRYSTSSRAGSDWWSLQPASDPAAPVLADDKWSRTDLDRFVLARLRANRLAPSPAATPRQLIRRLAIDLTGLPPSPDIVSRFEAAPTDQAYGQLVDQFLASPSYGERWGRHWLDVVRFGESSGFERNLPRKNSWPYRDWVISALNADMPYDVFARRQLIGDLLLPGREGAAASGFLVAGVHNTVVGGSKRMKLMARQDELEDLAASVGQTFLGLTINCARCHDHKFDPIPTTDYYRFISALDGVNHGEREVSEDGVADRLARVDKQVAELLGQLRKLESEVRQRVLKNRKDAKTPTPAESRRPLPFAEWRFDSDFKDNIGNLHGRPIGNARIDNGALVLDGKGSFVQTARLDKPLAEKTLAAWVQLDNLTQRGGSPISIQVPGGQIFDAIVFGEREAGQWMAGSNGFVRTKSFSAPVDKQAATRPVHIAITYKADGTITGYRNGQLYGRPYKTGFQRFESGRAEVVFGLRHSPAGGNRLLAGRILEAQLYDRVLSSSAIAAAAGKPGSYVPLKAVLAAMTPDERKRHAMLTRTTEPLLAQQRDLRTRQRSKIYTVTAGRPGEMRVHIRGSVTNYGPVVTPGGIGVVPGRPADFQLAPNAPDGDRRRKLAAWITSPDNALFARVMVNRTWHYHFGQGLVQTPSDFGFNGGLPSHPALLEWLTSRFRQDGMSLKALHRRIVLSSTYRQGSAPRQDGLDRDAGNRLLWRVSPRRAEAEVVRDAILLVSGQLNPQRGGPGFEDVSIIPNNGTTYYEEKDVDDASLYRRTVYRFTPRGGRMAILDAFDCPDPSTAAPTRSTTTTPLQALSLLNNSFVLRMAARMAKRVESDAGDNITRQVETAWRLAIQRSPDAREARLSANAVSRHGLATLCRALFNLNEFVIIE